MLYLVRLSVPRRGGWREWGAVSGDFERRLAGEQSRVLIGPRVDSEVRRGRDYVRVVIVATADAGDVAEALELAWWAFREAAGEDSSGWDTAGTAAEVRPAGSLSGLLPRGAPRPGVAAGGSSQARSRRDKSAHSQGKFPLIP